MNQVRVRFAPSPTGQLHIGNFRTALFNWLFARHHDGVFLVRIEDTDPERSKQEYTDLIMDTLQWVSITPDEPIEKQSDRLAEYKEKLDELLAANKAYRCYCTQEEIRQRAGTDLFIKYDGVCRDRADQPNRPYAVRFRIPDHIKQVAFDDLIRGRIVFERDQLDDFIIVRSDEWPTYNFVVVVDDAHMKISHIIRGEDHISNTPKQLLLYDAFGWAAPQFAHLPLILGPSGDRLSKRDAATSVMEYKQDGYLPDAFINYLVRLGWAHGDQEIFSRQELIELFTLKAVGKKGSIFDIAKFQWLNSVYIKNMSAKDLVAYMSTQLGIDLHARCADWNAAQLASALDLYKDRANTLVELLDELYALYDGPVAYDAQDYAKWITSDTVHHLEKIIALLEQKEFSSSCFALLKSLAKDLGIKIVQLMQPLRLALIGKSSGPGVCELIHIIGMEATAKRIHALVDYIQRT